MSNGWACKRSEFRFQLQGDGSGLYFFVGGAVARVVETIDVSRSGLCVVVEMEWSDENVSEVQLHLSGAFCPIVLEVRHRSLQLEEGQSPRTRLGLQVSEKDRARGSDLISAVRSSGAFRLAV